jgi:hypothetical protein
MADLLATMASIDPSVAGRRITLDRLDQMETGNQWHGTEPAIFLERYWDGGNQCFRMLADLNVPESLKATQPLKAAEITRDRYAAVRDWVLIVAAPEDANTLASVHELRRVPKRWTVLDPDGRAVRGWHSGGLAQASVSWVAGDIEADARTVLRGLSAAREAGARYTHAFGSVIAY